MSRTDVLKPLANYTTDVPATTTIAAIGAMLAAAGARSIVSDYGTDRDVVALAFVLDTAAGERAFRLPLDIDGVRAVLAGQVKAGLIRGGKWNEGRWLAEQARRVAWRIAREWLRAQLALIDAGAARLDQVMLPYQLVPGDPDGRTVWEVYAAGQLTAIGPA